jgi:hypothetical protein
MQNSDGRFFLFSPFQLKTLFPQHFTLFMELANCFAKKGNNCKITLVKNLNNRKIKETK